MGAIPDQIVLRLLQTELSAEFLRRQGKSGRELLDSISHRPGDDLLEFKDQESAHQAAK